MATRLHDRPRAGAHGPKTQIVTWLTAGRTAAPYDADPRLVFILYAPLTPGICCCAKTASFSAAVPAQAIATCTHAVRGSPHLSPLTTAHGERHRGASVPSSEVTSSRMQTMRWGWGWRRRPAPPASYPWHRVRPRQLRCAADETRDFLRPWRTAPPPCGCPKAPPPPLPPLTSRQKFLLPPSTTSNATRGTERHPSHRPWW